MRWRGFRFLGGKTPVPLVQSDLLDSDRAGNLSDAPCLPFNLGVTKKASNLLKDGSFLHPTNTSQVYVYTLTLLNICLNIFEPPPMWAVPFSSIGVPDQKGGRSNLRSNRTAVATLPGVIPQRHRLARSQQLSAAPRQMTLASRRRRCKRPRRSL